MYVYVCVNIHIIIQLSVFPVKTLLNHDRYGCFLYLFGLLEAIYVSLIVSRRAKREKGKNYVYPLNAASPEGAMTQCPHIMWQEVGWSFFSRECEQPFDNTGRKRGLGYRLKWYEVVWPRLNTSHWLHEERISIIYHSFYRLLYYTLDKVDAIGVFNTVCIFFMFYNI